MKKCLFAGLYGPTYSDAPLADAFRKNGYEVVIYDWQTARYNSSEEGMKARLIGLAQMEQPDLIFLHIQVPDCLDPETCEELSKIGFVVNYTFDVRDDISFYKEIAPYIGLTLFTCQEDVEECKKEGISNVALLMASCDTELYRPLKVHPDYKYDVAFIGSNYLNTNLNFPQAQERYDMVQMLKEKYGDRFYYGGMNWEESKFIKPDQEVEIYNSSKVCININNFDKTLYFSDRLWRIMSCGGFCLTKYCNGIEDVFEKGEHLDWFKNFDELIKRIEYYLGNDNERREVSSCGGLFVRSNHAWNNRIRIMEILIERYGK